MEQGELDVADLQRRLRRFAADRDWERFHTPKNLAMALAAEAGELLERFQWLTDEESAHLEPRELEAVREEIADVLIYLVRLADVLAIDLQASIDEKMLKNADRYPVELSRGNATKYSRREM